MVNLAETLSLLAPFNFLNSQELTFLIQKSTLKKYSPKMTIYRIRETAHDFMSILLSGTVTVMQHKKTINTIYAVAYFGERSVLLGGHRKANIIAQSPVECLDIPGEVIRHFIKTNVTFSHAFAEAMDTKHNLFFAYHQFVTLLYQYRHKENLNLTDLIPHYLELNPLLHKHAKSEEINFAALKYVLSRLPNNITETSHFFLSSDLPNGFIKYVNILRPISKRAKKRLYLNVLPGKLFVVLRDEMTDFIDFVTKLCLYYCETQKIIHKLSTSYYQNKKTKMNALSAIIEQHLKNHDHDETFIKKLPLTPHEKEGLSLLFDDKIIDNLYGIIAQNGSFDIHIKKPDARYSILSKEIWLNQIQKSVEAFIGQNYQQHQIHIIFSNHHSVNNCLSTWLHEQQNAIMSWGKTHLSKLANIVDLDDRLYGYGRYWQKAHPKEVLKRITHDHQQGILHIDDTYLNGVDVSVVNLCHIPGTIDTHLHDISKENFNNKIIINVDYAYGNQAQTCIESLILLFGKAIKSISVMGKAGGIIGKRGDIILPSHVMTQKDNSFMPIVNQSITKQNLLDAGWKRNIHMGNILTVLGTLMQNQEMLAYYQLFWDVIGLEMEASHYLKAIHTAIGTDMLATDVKINMAYYISDTPLKAGQNLSQQLKPHEGIPAVYSITRAILRHILLQH